MRQQSLVTQILTINAALILATALAGIAIGRVTSPAHSSDLPQAAVIVVGVFAAVLVNGIVLRRRFRSLERLIDLMEDVDLSRPGLRADVTTADASDVVRLCNAFNRMLERVEAERARTGSAVLAAQEQERSRLARDLHDECNQALTGILLRLEASSNHAGPELREELQTIKGLTGRAMDELLHLARELRPSALDDHGLRVALQTQADRFTATSGLKAALSVTPEASAGLAGLGEHEQIVVYRVVQEALSNVIRHARATHVEIAIDVDELSRVVVTVRDDGHGLEPTRREGLGIVGMRERARLAGGRVTVAPVREGHGTVVALTLAAQDRDRPGRSAA